jgi:phosphohistidine phosphatase
MRQILVVRHAEAEDPSHALQAGHNDAQRQLTKAGVHRMRRGAAGLASLVDQIHIIISSPLIRAIQTADILSAAFPQATLLQHARLAPGFEPGILLSWVSHQTGVIALVGHEPDLSQWIGYMTLGTSRSLVHMKKGSICRLDMPMLAQPGEARIAWCLTLKQLVRLA